MEAPEKYRVLDGTMLKCFAMVCMLVDHVGDIFFPGVRWMRMVGRLAMPIFSFFIAEGFAHSSNKKNYLLRMGLFALISEVPFDLAFDGTIGFSHQNVMVTFFLALLALTGYDTITNNNRMLSNVRERAKRGLGFLWAFALAILAFVLQTDYSGFGVLTVFLFYVYRNHAHWIRCAAGVGFMALTHTKGIYVTVGLSFFPLLLYNGQKGRGLKWLFYAFYPGHLLVLYLIKLLLR